jgi:hypothetical protein
MAVLGFGLEKATQSLHEITAFLKLYVMKSPALCDLPHYHSLSPSYMLVVKQKVNDSHVCRKRKVRTRNSCAGLDRNFFKDRWMSEHLFECLYIS